MENFLNQQLSRVLLDIEADLSSTGLAELSIHTLVDTIKETEFDTVEQFYEKFDSLYELVKETKPKIWILIYYFSSIHDELKKVKKNLKTKEDLFKKIDEILVDTKKDFSDDMDGIVKNWVNLINDGDKILIHTPSWTIKSILKEAKNKGKKFKIYLSEQSSNKTDNIIIFLQENNIDFVAIPEFMLSNIENDIDKIFAWALTLNSNYNFIVSAGLNSIISEFHLAGKKTYIFLSTKKFSLWKSDPKGITEVVNKTKDVCSHNPKIKPYQELKFSHDRVPVELFDSIITENSVLTPNETKALYDTLFTQRNK